MEINFDELKENVTLERSIFRRDGTLLINKGTKLTGNMIERLRKLGNSIKFEGDEEQTEPPKAPDGIPDAKQTVDEALATDTEEQLSEFINHPTEIQVQKIKDNVNKIVDKTLEVEEPQFDLDMYSQHENESMAHAVRVACFSILLARLYNSTVNSSDKTQQIDLRDIAVAAVLQDVGVTYKDSEKIKEVRDIIKESGLEPLFSGIADTPFTYYDEDYAGVYSYCAIANMDNVSKAAKLMVLLSKEPDVEMGTLKVPPFIKEKRNSVIYGSKIINVCNIYDNAMKQAIDEKHSLEEVIAQIGHYALNGIINPEIKELLINRVKLYPYKTRVILSNGRLATVEESRVGQYDSYKPVVRLRPYAGKLIDLAEVQNITIKSVVCKDEFNRLMQQQIEEMKNSNHSGR